MLNKPISYFDPDGLSAYVIHNPSGFGGMGHTGIAVDNPSGGVDRYDGANVAGDGGWPQGTLSGPASGSDIFDVMDSSDEFAYEIPDTNGSDDKIRDYLNNYKPGTTDYQ